MARRIIPPKRPAQLTPDEMRAGVARLRKRLSEVQSFDPTSVQDQFDIPHVKKMSAAIQESLQRTFGADSADYERYSRAEHFNNGPFNYAYQVPISEVRESLRRSKEESAALLEQAIEALGERLGEAIISAPALRPESRDRSAFVVHGHDDAARESVARFLENIGFRAVILHEQPNKGRTIIEKVEAHAEVGFAVVLLTPDDEGRTKGEVDFLPRARQNVLLELGYFVGRLGRERVCALMRGELELPSDFGGVAWVPFDESAAWKTLLGKELQAAGFEIDWNKVMR